jgi:uncharacterized protein
MSGKKTLVLGASSNPSQYSHLAVLRLTAAGHDTVAIGREVFSIGNVAVIDRPELFTGIDTVTLYLNANRQHPYEDYILSLHPRRIIFNPGAENPEFLQRASDQGIECLEACTLVMLSTGGY